MRWLHRMTLLATLLAAHAAWAVTGKFYASVDDEVKLYLNGKEVLHIGEPGIGHSEETDLASGGRLTAKLHNKGGPRHFILLSVVSDNTKTVSFPHSAFRILLDPEATDFTPEALTASGKMAKEDRAHAKDAVSMLPFKHHSELIWGERDDCALGCVITSSMLPEVARLASDLPSPKATPQQVMGMVRPRTAQELETYLVDTTWDVTEHRQVSPKRYTITFHTEGRFTRSDGLSEPWRAKSPSALILYAEDVAAFNNEFDAFNATSPIGEYSARLTKRGTGNATVR